jgi:hypothetical protein
MSILTLKSKTSVLIDPMNSISDFVYMELTKWSQYGNVYTAEGKYFYKVVDAYGSTDVPIKPFNTSLDIDSVNTIADSVSTTGTTYNEKQIEYIAAGAMQLVGTQNLWNLSITDWEISV